MRTVVLGDGIAVGTTGLVGVGVGDAVGTGVGVAIRVGSSIGTGMGVGVGGNIKVRVAVAVTIAVGVAEDCLMTRRSASIQPLPCMIPGFSILTQSP